MNRVLVFLTLLILLCSFSGCTSSVEIDPKVENAIETGNFQNLDLSGLYLAETNFDRTNWSGANLQGANLYNSDFILALSLIHI